VDGTYYFEENELIQKAYEKSLSINQKHPQALNPNFFIIKRYLNKQFLKGVPLEILV
jgi:hypothetical protein